MNVAFIPVRGGSKSIPLKNIKLINGKPLVYWAIKAAQETKYIDKIYVATDSNVIKETIQAFPFDKLEVIERSKESATDTASTEFAMLEFARQYEFDNIVLIQATSPLIKASDIEKGFDLINNHQADSILSVVRQKRFVWKNEQDTCKPVNYDVFHRPRRQEFEGFLVENGAFYITSKELLMKSNNRVSGNIQCVEMSEESYYEIDEPSDWEIIESIMKRQEEKKDIDIKDIKLFVTDSDGVLTDGGMYYSEFGDELKKFNTKDGMAFEILRKYGVMTAIITGEQGKLIKKRAQKLKIDKLYMGVKNKLEVLENLRKELKIERNNIIYVGDDINDIEIMNHFPNTFAPADANEEVKKVVMNICNKKGGEGIVREIVDKLQK